MDVLKASAGCCICNSC